MSEKSNQLFPTPFSRKYWECASAEMKSTRILVIAALLTALRIAVKALTIPVGRWWPSSPPPSATP